MNPQNNNPILRFYYALLCAPKVTLALCFVVLLVFGFFALKLPIDASSDSLILENDKDFKTYESIIKNYSAQNFLILALSAKQGDVFSKDFLNILQQLTNDLQKIPQIDGILSILNAPLLKSAPNFDLQESLKANLTLLSPQIDFELAKAEILNHPFYRQNLISKDSKTAGIIVYLKSDLRLKKLTELKNTETNEVQKQEIHKLIEAQKAKIQAQEYATIAEIKKLQTQYKGLQIGGIALIASDMITYVKSDLITYGATLSVILALMLWVFFRHLRFVFLTLFICLLRLLLVVESLPHLALKSRLFRLIMLPCY